MEHSHDAPAVPMLSVVVPAFNEEGNIRPLFAAIRAALDPLGLPWELVMADDGSRDGTWREIATLHASDHRVKGVRLSRNFGHQHALLAGLTHARGAAVISMDADLQHPPSLLAELVARWQEGAKVVHTVRRDGTAQPWMKRLTSRVFYRFYRTLTGSGIEPGMSDFRLLDRQVLDELLRFAEAGLFLRGLVHWVGYPATTVPFECGERLSGTTKYPFLRMVRFAWTGITSFSVTPLRIGVLMGVLTSGVACLSLLYAVGAWLLGLPTVPGWSSVLGILSFLLGVVFIQLGIIGEYLGKVLIEVKRRPRFLVRELAGEAEAGSRRTQGVRRIPLFMIDNEFRAPTTQTEKSPAPAVHMAGHADTGSRDS
jgi:dolichol-phosphate mannosyltransferase